MSTLDSTGAVSIAALDTSLKAFQNAVSLQVEVFDQVLEAQSDMMAEVLKLLDVGNHIDIVA